MTPEELRQRLPEGYILAEKDAVVSREAAEAALQELRFDREIDLELTRSGARNLSAARAMLDLNALREEPKKLKHAVGEIRRENSWLFGETPLLDSASTLSPRPAKPDPDQMSDEEYYRYRKEQQR